MHRYTVVYLTAFLIVGSLFAVYSLPLGTINARVSYNLHSPIDIDGDADLLAQAAAELWNGTGAEGDPIEIRDYEIDAGASGAGVVIINTRLHVLIDSCYIYSGWMFGVYLSNATNASIKNSIIMNCGEGIMLQGVSNTSVDSNECSSCSDGFYVDSSSQLMFWNNSCSGNTEGIYAYNVTDAEYINCTFSYNDETGIWMESCEMATIDRCHADYNDYGMYLWDCYWLMVTNSTCVEDYTGLYIESSNWFMISNNSMTGMPEGEGVYVDSCYQFLITYNNLTYDYYGAYIYNSQEFGFENNNISSNSYIGATFDTCQDFGARNSTCYEGNMGMSAYQSNGSLVNNTLWNLNYGIYAESSNGIRMDRNDCSNNAYGIYVFGSSGVELYENTCNWCNGAGIYADTVSYSRFISNNCSNGTSVLLLLYSDHNDVQDNNCSGNSGMGIDLEGSNHNQVMYNECNWNDRGIYLATSVNNSVMFNTCSNNTYSGIEVSWSSDQANINSNIVTENQYQGIIISLSSDAIVTNNFCRSNARGGIAIEASLNVTLMWNGLNHNGVWIGGNLPEYWYSHNIDQTNMVNGRPLVYLANQTSYMVTENAGQVIVANSQFVLVDGKMLSDATVGIEIGFSDTVRLNNSDCGENYFGAYVANSRNVQIANSSFGNSDTGMEVTLSSNVLIDNNTCWGGGEGIFIQITNDAIVKDNLIQDESYGIFLNDAHNVEIARNICNLNEKGILLYGSTSFVGVRNNTCNQNSDSGIYIDNSDSCLVENNTCSDNVFGINFWFSGMCTLKDNVMVGDGIYMFGYSLGHWNTHVITPSNTVNGKPVYYFKDTGSVSVPSDAGQVIFANCTMMTVSGVDLRAASVGVTAGFSSLVQVSNANCSDQYTGILLFESDQFSISWSDCSDEADVGVKVISSDGGSIANCSISRNRIGLLLTTSSDTDVTGNLFFANSQQGVYLGSFSTMNHIWNNTFAYNNGAMDNSTGFLQAYDDGGSNWWYEPGGIHGWGNYWNDWTSPDLDMNGIVDSPYNIPGTAGSRDMFPLVNRTAVFEPIPQFGLLVVVPLGMLLAVLVRRRAHPGLRS